MNTWLTFTSALPTKLAQFPVGANNEDRIEARYIAKNVASTAVDVRLTSCQIWEGFEDGKLCL